MQKSRLKRKRTVRVARLLSQAALQSWIRAREERHKICRVRVVQIDCILRILTQMSRHQKFLFRLLQALKIAAVACTACAAHRFRPYRHYLLLRAHFSGTFHGSGSRGNPRGLSLGRIGGKLQASEKPT